MMLSERGILRLLLLLRISIQYFHVRTKEKFPTLVLTYYEGISADGAIYWDWSSNRSSMKKILCFDTRYDNFKIVQKPENIKDNTGFALICLKGCLCLYCGRDEMTVQVWIKEKGSPDKNSWNVLMNIENFRKPVGWTIPLPFKENKSVIDLNGKKFLIYNACEKLYEEFEENGMLLFPYLDSMYFPVMKTRPKRKRSVGIGY